jgi:hypothetical protein
VGLTRGTKSGPYEIVDALGAGGMGEVYRATDTKLKRQVAIKTLPPSVATDPDRLARFQREAEVLAALNHPHIAGIQRFPGPATKWPVSSTGGTQIRWRRDGRELFYVAADGKLMSVPIRVGPNPEPEIGTPAALFVPPLGGAVQQGDDRIQYMVGADGRRFLVATVSEEAAPPITVILNWKPKP